MADIKRKLATIQTIKTVEPIEGADKIVKLTFESMNWVCVTATDTNPVPGQKRVYFEVDSVLPALELFAFMEPYKYRVKTIKLRGQVSQGLTVPLAEIVHMLPVFSSDMNDLEYPWSTYPDGYDLTGFLQVTKYEAPESVVQGDAKGSFPGYVEKTDEDRAQNIPHLDKILAEVDLRATVKMDGTSFTAFTGPDGFGVCSRNQELKRGDNTHWKMAEKYGLEDRMTKYGKPIALQGEICGPGIQSNRAKLQNLQLFIFTAQNLETNTMLLPEELDSLIKELNAIPVEGTDKIQQVPDLGIIKAGTLKTIGDLEAFATGTNVVTDTTREGVVFRGMGISFKFINPKYLLKYDL